MKFTAKKETEDVACYVDFLYGLSISYMGEMVLDKGI